MPLSADVKLRHVYLTWQDDPCRTITITTHGIKTPESLTVYYDTEPHHSQLSRYPNWVTAKGERKLYLEKDRRIFHVQLTNLEPGTVYYFTIGDNKRAFGPEKHFRTIPLSTPLLFVEGGDWENTEAAIELAKQAASLSPHAALLGGDYPSHVFGIGGYKKWDKWLDMYTQNMITPEGHLIPMVMAIGNHEVIGGYAQPKKQVPFFFRYFPQGGTEESYFSLPFGEELRLFVLDSGHTSSHDGPQRNWLEKELSEASEPVKMALYHVPLYPSIRFAEKGMIYSSVYRIAHLLKDEHSANKLFSRESKNGQKYWLPLFDRYGLTVAFEHHDQTLKRTKLLREGREDPKGTLYLGDGGWGPKVQYAPLQGYFHRYFVTLRGRVHFFWVVEVEKEQITYRAISPSGEVIDQFVQKL